MKTENKMKTKYKQALENYNYDSGSRIFARIENSKNIEDQQDIINDIILWKINREAEPNTSVIKKLLDVHEIQLNDLCTNKKGTEDRVKDLLISLIKTKGIRLPMASTILHFYNPETFPIIDQRAYRELYDQEAPCFTEKNSCDIYIKYINDCYKYWKENCKCDGIKFSDIDKVLYQLDKEKNNTVKGY